MGFVSRFSKSDRRLRPDFLSSLTALANFMLLSLMKAAYGGVGGASWQEIRVAHLFRPTYA
jgi:hypothetical protein